jgi:hypothetical protein
MRRPLESRRVDRIHARLLVRYGTRWTQMWAGIEQAAVHRDWAEELGGISDAAIAHALDNLPAEFPPTVAQFRALCLAHAPTFKALPSPAQDPTVARAVLKAIARPAEGHPKEWAWRLKEREERGDKLIPVQRAFWREALRGEVEA